MTPLVLIPFSKATIAVAAGQSRHLHETGHAKELSALLVADLDVNAWDLWKVLKYARRAFKSVDVVQPAFRLPSDPGFSWANWMVQSAIVRFMKSPDTELLVLPCDCMTVHPGWLYFLVVGDRRRQMRAYPSKRSVSLWLKAVGHHKKDWFKQDTSRGFELVEALGKYRDGIGIVAGPKVEEYLIDLGSKAPPVLSPTRKRIRIRRWAAIGDVIASTSVARKLHEQGYEVHMETFAHCSEAIMNSPFVSSVSENGGHDVNLDLAYENHPEKATRHIADIFIEASNAQLKTHSIELGLPKNFAPTLAVTEMEKEWANGVMAKHLRPWTVVCPRSHMDARSVPAHVIGAIGNRVPGTVFWCSDAKAPEKTVDLQVRTIRHLMAFISQADLVVSVDSAPLHIAAGLRKPTLAIRQSFDPALRISNQRDVTTFNRTDLPCLPCTQYMCKIDKDRPPCGILAPTEFSGAINSKLNGIFEQTVSAIIPVYKTKVERLNRCLKAILPQVDEVVIGVDGDGLIPKGVIESPKIRYVKHVVPERMGYGHTCNLASRESTGRYLLMLNDDCFAAPNMVAMMKRQMTNPDFAVVGGLLRYPDGRIQHGGTFLQGRNFGHIDHLKTVATIRNTTTMKFVTFAAALVRRTAFFEVSAFDEDFDAYGEDSDLCLRLGQSGWKVIYEPLATAIHEESQTTSPMKLELLRNGNALFERKWGLQLNGLQGI